MFTPAINFISRLKMYISSLEIHISKLEIYISNLEMKFHPYLNHSHAR
ncbi:hypothetical protein [Bacteroides sp. UBA939]|nr:hypothetical protein [Bacteroides sp. UBA939]